MHRIVKIINRLYTKHLFVTNTVTCSVLLGIGDGIVQYIDRRRLPKSTTLASETGLDVSISTTHDKEILSKSHVDKHDVEKEMHGKSAVGKDNEFDLYRTARMCAMGVVMGPLNHFFYLLLDRYLVGRGMKIICKKIALDQIIAAPMFNTAFIFGSCYLEKKTTQTAAKEWMEKFPVIYVGDWVYWPPVQVINFYYFPSQYRVLFVANATLLWNVYISYVKHHDVKISTAPETQVTQDSLSTEPYKTDNVPMT